MQMAIIPVMERKYLFSVWERMSQNAKLQAKLYDFI
jgi:hypothetical protein